MAPFRRAALPRTGRIKADNATTGQTLTIVKGVAGKFRIFNTDKTKFSVKPGTLAAVDVEHRCAVDVDTDGDIVITAAADGDLKGIYELINPYTSIRSGKFRRNGDFTIVQGMGRKAFYRILNTDKQHSFEVKVNGTLVVELKPRMAVDVTARNSISISAANKVSGIFDYLDPRNVIQPGRFNVTLANAGDQHTIIDLAASNEKAVFRVHNSGATPFIVMRGATGIAPAAAPLQQDQSIDFVINAADADADKKVTISAAAAAATVQGMFEYVGPDTSWLS